MYSVETMKVKAYNYEAKGAVYTLPVQLIVIRIILFQHAMHVIQHNIFEIHSLALPHSLSLSAYVPLYISNRPSQSERLQPHRIILSFN